MLLSDDILVRDTLDGSGESFRLLVERHQGRLFAIAAGMLRSDDQAADAVQEAFLKAYRSLGQYRGPAFGAWLRRHPRVASMQKRVTGAVFVALGARLALQGRE